jgi:hypothetical protein
MVETVIAGLVPDIEDNEQNTGQSQAQGNHIDQGVGLGPGEASPSGFEVILQHRKGSAKAMPVYNMLPINHVSFIQR